MRHERSSEHGLIPEPALEPALELDLEAGLESSYGSRCEAFSELTHESATVS